MHRWWLIPRNPIFNIYLHVWRRDDDDRAVHDHPWVSMSLQLGRPAYRVRLVDGEMEPEAPIIEEAGMREIYRRRDGMDVEREVPFGSLVLRGARFAHRMLVPNPGVVTLFITGPSIREWGFLCPRGWVRWEEFVDARDKGVIGRGCGEV